MHLVCEPSAAPPFHCERAGVLVARICRMHQTSAEQPGMPPSDCMRLGKYLGILSSGDCQQPDHTISELGRSRIYLQIPPISDRSANIFDLDRACIPPPVPEALRYRHANFREPTWTATMYFELSQRDENGLWNCL